jgi:hypothetical protein
MHFSTYLIITQEGGNFGTQSTQNGAVLVKIIVKLMIKKISKLMPLNGGFFLAYIAFCSHCITLKLLANHNTRHQVRQSLKSVLR